MTEIDNLRKIAKEHDSLLKDYFKLQDAARTLYYAAHWKSDRLPTHIEELMWADLKIAACALDDAPKRITK